MNGKGIGKWFGRRRSTSRVAWTSIPLIAGRSRRCAQEGEENFVAIDNRARPGSASCSTWRMTWTSKRLATVGEGAWAPRCQSAVRTADRASSWCDLDRGRRRRRIAVNNLMPGEGLREPVGRRTGYRPRRRGAGRRPDVVGEPVRSVLASSRSAPPGWIATWCLCHAVALPVIETAVVAMFALATMIA